MRWVLLVYRIPREPSRHRVAVWRKLRDLGALYLQDGVAALPEDAVTREQLEWLQLRVREAGGEATLWEARPGTVAEEAGLVEDVPLLAGGGLPGHHRRGRAPAAQGPDGRRWRVGATRQAGARVQGREAQGLLPFPAAPGGSERTQGRPRSREGQRRAGRGRQAPRATT